MFSHDADVGVNPHGAGNHALVRAAISRCEGMRRTVEKELSAYVLTGRFRGSVGIRAKILKARCNRLIYWGIDFARSATGVQRAAAFLD
jgi:hypothetical protein